MELPWEVYAVSMKCTEMEVHNAGPLLRLQEDHISTDILSGKNTERVLNVRHNYIRGDDPHPKVLKYIQMAGFGHLYNIGSFKIDHHLISALVERWRPETHTFHLPYGECTVTLEDVSLQMGLNAEGRAVTGQVIMDWYPICQSLLGSYPPANEWKGHAVNLTWFASNFAQLPDDASDTVAQQYARAYIIRLIGGIMMPDKSGSRVHMMYLPLLDDLSKASEYSWGSATLAFLYRELCKATKRGIKEIGGCLILLQSWAWDHIPHIAPTYESMSEIDAYAKRIGVPLARRWTRPRNTTNTPSHAILYYRSSLDQLSMYQFIWQPYQGMIELRGITNNYTAYWAVVPLICFAIVEWHPIDRVVRQFGGTQPIPSPSVDLDKVHNIDMRGKGDIYWPDYHKAYIKMWDERSNRLCLIEPGDVAEMCLKVALFDLQDKDAVNEKHVIPTHLKRKNSMLKNFMNEVGIVLMRFRLTTMN